jgi:hypothetical protein
VIPQVAAVTSPQAEAEVQDQASAPAVDANLPAPTMASVINTIVIPNDETTTFPDNAPEINDARSEGDDDEQPKDWNDFDYLKSAMSAVGLDRQCRSIKINTKTTPCIVDDPRGYLHVVVQKRLHDAVPIDVVLFRRIVQMASDILIWCKDDVMPPRCHLVKQLRVNQGCPYIRAGEITLIVLHDGLVAINPNKDWSIGSTSTNPDREYLPGAVTVGMYTVPITRREAIRWLENDERGANWRTEVAPKTVVPGRSEFKTARVADLGCHSRYSDPNTKCVDTHPKP